MAFVISQSVGHPNLVTRQDCVATVLSLLDGAWRRVRNRPALGTLSEPAIAGLLYLEIWKEKRRRKMLGPPFPIDEAAARSRPMLLIPDGWIDLKFVYSFSDEQSFFGVECKRVRSSDRRLIAEYVNSGVMRFVAGSYSRDHDLAAMCGFVIDGRVQPCARTLESQMHLLRTDTRQIIPWHIETRFGNRKGLFTSTHQQRPKNTPISLLHLLLSCSPPKRSKVPSH